MNWKAVVHDHARAQSAELPPEVQEELASHLEDAYQHAIRQGATEHAARERALHALAHADLASFRKRRRAIPQRQSRLQGVEFDFRYAFRLLYRTPIFSLTVATILAVSIGATCAAFSVIDAVLLRPLPYPDAHQLVLLSRVDKTGKAGSMSSADWRDYSTRAASFTGIAAYSNWTHNLTGDGEPLRLRSVITSGNFFSILGSAPQIGRAFDERDDRPDAPAVVVLSDGFWTRRFGRDANVVGRTLTLNARAATVVGVMPPAFTYPSREVDLWMPIGMSPELQSDRASEWLQAVARLNPRTSLDQARQEAGALAAALASGYPKTNAGEGAALVPLLEHVVGNVRPALLIVTVAVLFVFLVTCLNVANLLLARASTRQIEMAIRMAIGADRWRLTRQVLAETGVLTALAGAAGLALAWALLRGLSLVAANRIPRLEEVAIDWTAVLATTAASALVLACCGVMAMTAFGPGVAEPLTRSDARVVRAMGLRPALLTIQIAVSFVLVTAALLVGASYVQMQRVAAGFSTDDVLSVRLTLARQKYPDGAAHSRFADAVVDALSTAPGVTSAGVVNDLPFAGNQMSFAIAADDLSSASEPPPRATVRFASAGYFSTLKIPIISGRPIARDDGLDRERVAVVNLAAARRYWSGDAIGKRVQIGESKEWRRVVGVVADSRHAGLQRDEGPVVYLPYAQKPFDFVNWMGVLVRGPSAETLVRTVKARLHAIDPLQPAYDVMLLDDYLARERAPYRLNSWIVGSLALLSLVLAIAGVFALTAYDVAARKQEFGIRLALGATGASVLRLVLSHTLKVVLLGATLGAIGAVFAAQGLTAVLYGTTPGDPRVFAAVAVAIVLSAAAAAAGPALRAAHVDPVTTLRAE
jgi:putative ABC transport system permease protein